MDAKTVQAFKDIIKCISEDAIDEMAENGIELNSTNYQTKMEVKFKRFAQLLA